jgi:hypothetical protein
VFGGDPNCEECGCSISTALHWIGAKRYGGVKVRNLVEGSVAIGRAVNRIAGEDLRPARWKPSDATELVKIKPAG